MTRIHGSRLYVEVSASEARRRLKGHGYGVRRVESAGTKRAAIVHTAAGLHLRQLESLFHDALSPKLDGSIDAAGPSFFLEKDGCPD